MPSTIVFEFDRPEPVYYSGESINGRILLQTAKIKSVREIYILFEGKAKVRWEERKARTENGKTHYYSVYYTATESYLDSRTTVFSEGTLSSGTHVYTFNISLPPHCPTSCTEDFGSITYLLSLVLNRPYRFDNIFSQPLTVIRQLNLNLHPELLVSAKKSTRSKSLLFSLSPKTTLQIPLKNEDIKYFCCWPCSSGPVLSTLTIPFGGYAPGQIIKYTLEIDNQSTGYDLEDNIELSLKQTYKFVANEPYRKVRYHSNTLAKSSQEIQCLRLSKRLIDGSLTIPPVPPTSTDGLISLRYDIKMTIDTGTCHTNQEISIPITIGTIPLAQSAINPENARALMPSAPNMPETGDGPPNYDEFKPPSFEEATIGGRFVDTDIDEHNRIEGFIPKYPMYTNFADPTAPPPPFETTSITATPANAINEPILQSNLPPNADSSEPASAMNRSQPTTTSEGYGWKV